MQFNNIIEHHNVSVERGPMETLSLLSRAIGQSHFGHFSLCIFILQPAHCVHTQSLLQSLCNVFILRNNSQLCIIEQFFIYRNGKSRHLDSWPECVIFKPSKTKNKILIEEILSIGIFPESCNSFRSQDHPARLSSSS